MKIFARLTAGFFAWLFIAAVSYAQFPGPGGGQFGGGQFSRPTVSPYLNLLNGGNPALNYYGLVRPQFAYDRAFQTLGANVNSLGANVNSLEAANQAPQTGHRSSFMTHNQYFMNNGSGKAAGGQTGARPGGQATQQGAQQGSQQRAPSTSPAGR